MACCGNCKEEDGCKNDSCCKEKDCCPKEGSCEKPTIDSEISLLYAQADTPHDYAVAYGAKTERMMSLMGFIAQLEQGQNTESAVYEQAKSELKKLL